MPLLVNDLELPIDISKLVKLHQSIMYSMWDRRLQKLNNGIGMERLVMIIKSQFLIRKRKCNCKHGNPVLVKISRRHLRDLS